jgi:hypothetical protein
MEADTVVAICATVIAVASLSVSVFAAWATMRHNRLSVQPLLEVRPSFHPGRTAGIQLVNAGLGPAVITDSVLRLRGERLGPWNEATVNQVREMLSPLWPSAVTFSSGSILATDYDRYLLYVEDYDPDHHAALIDLIRCRLGVEFSYRSIYGGQTWTAEWTPRPEDEGCAEREG